MCYLFVRQKEKERQCWVKAERESLKKGKCQFFGKGSTYIKDVGDGTFNLAGKFCPFNRYNFQNRCNRYVFEIGLRLGVASSVKLLYLGILYRFIGAGKFFPGFFYRFIGEENLAQQNCTALFDFFLKNCVSVSL